MLDQALGLLDHHLGNLHVAGSRLVEGGADDLPLHRPLHVGHFLRALVDQQHDEVALRVIGRDGMGDVLQQHRLAGARRGDDQAALALAQRRDDVDDARGIVLLRRVAGFHLEPLIGIKRRQIVEMNLVTGLLGILEVDPVDLDKSEVAFTLLRTADLAFHRVAGAQRELPDLARADIDVIRPGQIVRVRRAEEAEAILQHLDNAFADDFHIAGGKVLENGEQQLLLAECTGIFNFQFFRQRHEFGR